MLSSVAERLYWLGRYLERVENTARLVNVYSNMLLDLPSGSHIDWTLLLDITGCRSSYNALYPAVEERQVLRFLLAELDTPGSVLNSAKAMRENARTTREIIPSEAWELINQLYHRLRDDFSHAISRRSRQQTLETVIGDCQRIFGVFTGCMNHDTPFAFIQLGRKVERADMTSRIVDVGSISMLPGFTRNQQQQQILEPWENIVWMHVLLCVSGYQAYRQRTQSQVKGEDVVKFLLQDEAFPRSLGYCLQDLLNHLEGLPNNANVQLAVARVRKLTLKVQISELLQRGLLEFIDELQISIADIHEEIANTWFRPVERREQTLQRQAQ
jgi:uncharacterized alpha-E superfamily protein